MDHSVQADGQVLKNQVKVCLNIGYVISWII